VTLLPAVLEAARNTLMRVAYDGQGSIWFLDKAAARLME
jgi:hypothetical protein